MNVRELDKRVIAFATREVWKKKLVQAKRIRCQKCVQIVKLWLKTYGYGPKKYVLREDVSSMARQKERHSRPRPQHPKTVTLGARSCWLTCTLPECCKVLDLVPVVSVSAVPVVLRSSCVISSWLQYF